MSPQWMLLLGNKVTAAWLPCLQETFSCNVPALCIFTDQKAFLQIIVCKAGSSSLPATVYMVINVIILVSCDAQMLLDLMNRCFRILRTVRTFTICVPAGPKLENAAIMPSTCKGMTLTLACADSAVVHVKLAQHMI